VGEETGRQDTQPTAVEVCSTWRGKCFATAALLLPDTPPDTLPAGNEPLFLEKARLLFLLPLMILPPRPPLIPLLLLLPLPLLLLLLLLLLEVTPRVAQEAMAGMADRSHTLTVLSLLPVATTQACEGHGCHARVCPLSACTASFSRG
jgi:hypothetical protein